MAGHRNDAARLSPADSAVRRPSSSLFAAGTIQILDVETAAAAEEEEGAQEEKAAAEAPIQAEADATGGAHAGGEAAGGADLGSE